MLSFSYREGKCLADEVLRFQSGKTSLVWALFFLGIVDSVWAYLSGYKFSDVFLHLTAIVILGGIGFACGRTERRKPFSEMAYYAALWIAICVLGAIFSYLMASLRFPLFDEYFVKFDTVLGFEWLRWHRFLAQYPFINSVLYIAYKSILSQIILSIIYFSYIRQSERISELYWTALISLLLTLVLSGIFPALGAFQYFEVDLTKAIHLTHLLALRNGNTTTFSVHEMQGIVTLPSYHTVLAILFMHTFRGKGFLFLLISLLNILMLLSTPTFGGHYLVDMISGALIAGLTIYLVHRGPRMLAGETFKSRWARAAKMICPKSDVQSAS